MVALRASGSPEDKRRPVGCAGGTVVDGTVGIAL